MKSRLTFVVYCTDIYNCNIGRWQRRFLQTLFEAVIAIEARMCEDSRVALVQSGCPVFQGNCAYRLYV